MSKPGDRHSTPTGGTASGGTASGSDSRSDIDRRILRLARKYLKSPDRETAVKLAAAIYPIVFASCYDLGGGLAAVSQSAKAVVDDLFDNLESLLSARRASRYVSDRAYRVAARRALQTEDDRASSDFASQGADAADLTGPGLSVEARRGITLLRSAAVAPDPSLSPLLREALDSLPPGSRVALVLGTVSSWGPEDLDAFLSEARGPNQDEGKGSMDLMAGAALSIFEHLGKVAVDE